MVIVYYERMDILTAKCVCMNACMSTYDHVRNAIFQRYFVTHILQRERVFKEPFYSNKSALVTSVLVASVRPRAQVALAQISEG